MSNNYKYKIDGLGIEMTLVKKRASTKGNVTLLIRYDFNDNCVTIFRISCGCSTVLFCEKFFILKNIYDNKLYSRIILVDHYLGTVLCYLDRKSILYFYKICCLYLKIEL